MKRLRAAIAIVRDANDAKWFRRCSICGRLKLVLPYETPEDIPFYPAGEDNHHCTFCEYWLQTGEFHRHDPRGSKDVF